MNSNVLAQNPEMAEQTDAIYGSNKINYQLFVMGLCESNPVQHSGGTLTEQEHKQITYDVAQKFPTDKFASVLKSTATEIAQVHGVAKEFTYSQYPIAVEFILSNIQKVNPINIKAGIIKNLLKKFDYEGYVGVNGNYGIKTNPNTVSNSKAITAYASLVTALTGAVSRARAVGDITSDDLGRLTFAYSGGVAKMLNVIDSTAQLSNLNKLKMIFPDMVFKEIPSNLEDDAETLFYVVIPEMMTFHYASIPAQFAEERGRYGLSTENLFTYESCAIEVEEKGAIQLVTKS